MSGYVLYNVWLNYIYIFYALNKNSFVDNTNRRQSF